ncbi:hypothetical protein [Halobaculum litoreum]|uniref:Flagellin N-terminal-like domain-containing protein n=1 Tax=Halobaculum litoreum TaxID=3031998 RepID=A0ABD5XSA2_9EURY|nr:hypothetical protein [Halobaculum sp. DT92]
MADGGGADRGSVISTGRNAADGRHGSGVEGWVTVTAVLAAVLLSFFATLVVVSYV